MTERKTPQDRLSKQEPAEKPEGWDLLKPPGEVPGWDQADLLATMQPLLILVDDNGEIDLDPAHLDFRIIGDLGRLVHERFAIDPAAFQRLTSGGMDGLSKMLQVCFWYFDLLGKSGDSATS